jgi:hypothetical protein
VEQIKDTVGVDAHRATLGWRVGLVADGINQASLGGSFHLHGASFTVDTKVLLVIFVLLRVEFGARALVRLVLVVVL